MQPIILRLIEIDDDGIGPIPKIGHGVMDDIELNALDAGWDTAFAQELNKIGNIEMIRFRAISSMGVVSVLGAAFASSAYRLCGAAETGSGGGAAGLVSSGLVKSRRSACSISSKNRAKGYLSGKVTKRP